MVSLKAFIDRMHCGPGFDSDSNRNEYQEYFLGDKDGWCIRADNLTTFMCRLSWNLGASDSWNHQGLSRSVRRLFYLTQGRSPRGSRNFPKFMDPPKAPWVLHWTVFRGIWIHSILTLLYHIRLYFPSCIFPSIYWTKIFYILLIFLMLSTSQTNIADLVSYFLKFTTNYEDSHAVRILISFRICGNKMPTRCNRGFYCRSYCLLNMFRAPLCLSSGAQEYYTVVAACDGEAVVFVR